MIKTTGKIKNVTVKNCQLCGSDLIVLKDGKYLCSNCEQNRLNRTSQKDKIQRILLELPEVKVYGGVPNLWERIMKWFVKK